MRYLFDTCVVSELISRNPNDTVLRWVSQQNEKHVYLSVVTIGEIQHGIEKLADGKRKESLTKWLEEDLMTRFNGKILDIDVNVMMQWGRIVAGLERIGKPMPVMDSIIAAVAIEHDLHLVTRNVKDFENLDLRIVNPWVSDG
ncbi:type II toxin-antitoxin system VapC family toxin [bacterium]|nr:type II toxin-antitoxin system VapC family toxin [bacterium]